MNGRRVALRWAVVATVLCAAIIVPFVIWEETLAEASRRWLESPSNRGVVGAVVALLLALDLVLPIPSSFVSAAAVAALGSLPGALAVWTGMTLGAFAGYAIGRAGGTPLVERFVGVTELERAERLAARFGRAVLVVCRGVPVLAEASVLVAGAARMHFFAFAWVTALSNLGLSAAYALLTREGASGAAAFLVPFALGIAVPAVAIVVVKHFERRA